MRKKRRRGRRSRSRSKGLYYKSRRVWLRFKRLFRVNEATGCMEWRGALVKGYPRFYIGKIDGQDAWRPGHRYSLERKLGRPLLTEEIACHQCDVPVCVNPDHLEVGSHQDNMDEMKERNRAASGEDNAMTTLTWADADYIREAPKEMSHAELGRTFNVSGNTIARIRRGETWQKSDHETEK